MPEDGDRPDSTTTEAFAIVASPSGGGPPKVTWTDLQGAHVFTLGDRAIAGAASEAAIVLKDPTVSRLHAELELRDDGIWIRDLGSKNGTFVEGVRVTGARVPRVGRVHLGSALVRVEYARAPDTRDTWPEDHYGPLLGGSRPMRVLFAMIDRVARTEASILVQGETGTGKELVARAIHDASPRSKGPFVVVDCGAIPENLVESQLFGHAKGAFTGAMAPRMGDLEAADGGTLFLDEIGELPLSMQPKLLRALESRTIRRVGETATRAVDVRFVSATHRDLGAMVNAGAFREDLYFRLAVVPLRIPSLRERLEDLPQLVQRFVPKGSGAVNVELFAELSQRPWLGNVRELRNFVERALAMGTHEALRASDGDAKIGARRGGEGGEGAEAGLVAAASGVSLDQPLREFREQWNDHGEREYVRRLIAAHAGNVSAAAQTAGVDRTYVHRLIKKHGL
jgi:two-component system, NtrC family, response regulator GlrR